MEIQPYLPDQANEIADLFHASVHAIDPAIYSLEQQEAWAPSPPDYTVWKDRLEGQQPYVAMVDGQIVGFIELEADGFIDCFYTHPDFQRQGIASKLYTYILNVANRQGIDQLSVQASLTALPFFVQRGFTIVRKNELYRHGVTLINYDLVKPLSSDQ
ncbi:GNAT family N-acetyltransferase [uncultured Neptuniibacter sp.]|uniref:GNAT family N-acetyltransferase n=1 Tax=uncultured Neptuniibacter sp. TaxID=502143 RepID=UPI002617D0E0|nr:GNAT family N-acetyltransferase [uncultured Neptuniibacter sp.]